MFMTNSSSSRQMDALRNVSISSSTKCGKHLSPKSTLTNNNANCLDDELTIITKNSFLHVNVPMRPSVELCLKSVSRSNSCPDLSSYYFNEMSSSWAGESSVQSDSIAVRESFSTARLTIQQDLSGLEDGSHSVETESSKYLNLQDSDPTKVMLDWCDCEQDDFAKKKKVPAMSVGSINHHLGECEPCAFYYSEKECTNRSDCKFCHLCPPGEFKRQKKGKFSAVKEENKMLSGQVAAAAVHSAYDRKRMDSTEKVVFNINLGSALCLSEAIIPGKTFNKGSQGCDNNFSLMLVLGLGGLFDESQSPEAADELGNKEFRTSRNAFRMRTRRRRHRGAFGSF